jgi:Uma2 family endonuclease
MASAVQEKNTESVVEHLAPPPMTFEDFLEWAGDTTWAEWVDGKVIFLMARDRHQRIADFLQTILQAWADMKGAGGVAWTAPYPMRCLPDGPGREPDVLYLRRESMTRASEVSVEGPADIVVEIVSPDSVRRDRIEKFAEYEAGGVAEYWIIDPASETVEFYIRADTGHYFRRAPVQGVTADTSGTYVCAALNGMPIHLDWLWQPSLPSLIDVFVEWNVVPAPSNG